MPWGQFFMLLTQVVVVIFTAMAIVFVGSAVAAAIRSGFEKRK